jgi:hypothetical protein
VEGVTIGDMPELFYRDSIVRANGVSTLHKIWTEYIKNVGNSKFDIKTAYNEIFIRPKAKYLSEVIKQT